MKKLFSSLLYFLNMRLPTLHVFDVFMDQKGKTRTERDYALPIYKIGSHKTFYVKL